MTFYIVTVQHVFCWFIQVIPHTGNFTGKKHMHLLFFNSDITGEAARSKQNITYKTPQT